MFRLFLATALAACLALPGTASAKQPAPKGAQNEASADGLLPSPEADVDYTVRAGDTMIGISRRYLVNGDKRAVQRALWVHNQLKDKDSIRPGQVIRIPGNWMRNEGGQIELSRVEGEAQSKGQALKAGDPIAAGDDLRTGKDGFVTIRLADGSTLALQPGSEMQIEAVRKSPLDTAPDAKFLLKSGRVEAAVQKRPPNGARFEVRTPIAVAAVRGTKFRVSADSDKHTATSEVLEGAVQVNDSGNLGSVTVKDGFGTRVKEGEPPAQPRALLAAPRLWTGIRLWVRRPVKLNFTRLEGASSYRLLVAKRADFAEVIFTDLLKKNEIALPDLENGPYFLKIRGIDDLGLEGRDTTADLVLGLPSADSAAASSPPTPVPAPPAAGPWPVEAPKKSP